MKDTKTRRVLRTCMSVLGHTLLFIAVNTPTAMAILKATGNL